MIYLYTLPGVAFNAPQINVPLIKGYLNNNNITTKQFDLSITFLEQNINSLYIKKYLNSYYLSLTMKERRLIDNISKIISTMQTKKINTDAIIDANEKLLKILNIYSKYYDINWDRRGISFNKKISTIDELLSFAQDSKNKIFDSVLKCDFTVNRGDIFYFSVQYPFQLPYAIRFAKKIKNKYDVKIILGGDYITHITKNCEELMEKCNYIDGIVFFGNHATLMNLITFFKGANSDSEIPNTIIRIKEKIINNNIKKIKICDKDNYIPSFDDLNINKYLSNINLIPLTLNYGCYHSKCKFCSRYFYYNGYFRYNLNEILKFIKKEYEEKNIQAIYFVDECVPAVILVSLAQYLIDNHIQIKWMVETRIDNIFLNNDIVNLLYESGCRQISFGIESYNNRVLKDMNKNINLKVAKKVMKNFFTSGISVSATFMIGYPTETILNTYKTLNFIKKFKYLDTFGLSVFNYMRNSILVNSSNIDEKSDLNLIYRTNSDNREFYDELISRFNMNNKICNFSKIREKILYRSQYMYLDRAKYSLNYKDSGR